MDSGGKLKQELRQSQSDLNQTATEPLCPQGQEIQPHTTHYGFNQGS